jgi:C4-dicarboxylate-specific signal transduction histidine kinase
MGLYEALEARSKERVKQGVVSPDEQIALLEKVANTQGELDQANATIEASRLALIGQCRPEVMNEVNNYILGEIK